MTYDAGIRGWIAKTFTCAFVGILVFTIVLRVLGRIAPADMEIILQQCVLYLGPLMGAIFGYYFRSPPA